jgi:hypothetical protein
MLKNKHILGEKWMTRVLITVKTLLTMMKRLMDSQPVKMDNQAVMKDLGTSLMNLVADRCVVDAADPVVLNLHLAAPALMSSKDFIVYSMIFALKFAMFNLVKRRKIFALELSRSTLV